MAAKVEKPMGGANICEKHGLQGCITLCEHVRAQFEAGETPVGHYLDAGMSLMVCDRCFKTGGFDKVPKIPRSEDASKTEEDWEAVLGAYEAVEAPLKTLQNPRGYCPRCLEALGPKYLSGRDR